MTTMEGDEPISHWDLLVPRVLHPLKVAIIEAVEWIGQPLSASDLTKLVDDPKSPLSNVSYHVRNLAELGAIEVVGDRRVRGAIETFYFFPSEK